jgi:hypothetical protein
MTLKYNLEDTELQELADKLTSFVQEEYKNDADGIPEHVLNALAQNFVLKHKNHEHDICQLLDECNIPKD